MFSLNLHIIFLVLATKIHPILHFVVQLSQFLIWDNGPPSMLAVANSSFSNTCQVADAWLQVISIHTVWRHYSLVHEDFSATTVQTDHAH
jgi:hypothetical protein